MFALAVFGAATGAAQDNENTSVLLAHGGAPEVQAYGSSVQRAARVRTLQLASDGQVHAPSVTLVDLQLAVGCMGLTPDCLDLVAEQLDADELIVPVIERAGKQVLLSLIRYERNRKRVREAVRELPVESEPELLQAIEPMVRELFGLPTNEGQQEGGVSHELTSKKKTNADVDSAADRPSRDSRDRSAEDSSGALQLVPWVVGGLGVASLGVGIFFAVSTSNTQAEFDRAPAMTAADVMHLRDLKAKGSTEATLSNVFIGAGAGLLLSGALLYLLVEPDSDEHVTLTPALGPGHAGLTLQGRGYTW